MTDIKAIADGLSEDVMILLLSVYDAGIRRGCDETSAYEAGAHASSDYADELIEVLCDSNALSWSGAKALVFKAIEARAHIMQEQSMSTYTAMLNAHETQARGAILEQMTADDEPQAD